MVQMQHLPREGLRARGSVQQRQHHRRAPEAVRGAGVRAVRVPRGAQRLARGGDLRGRADVLQREPIYSESANNTVRNT